MNWSVFTLDLADLNFALLAPELLHVYFRIPNFLTNKKASCKQRVISLPLLKVINKL